MGLSARGLAAAVLAAAFALPAAASAADWSTFGFASERTNENPFERAIGVGNAGGLHEVWSAPLEGVANAQPLVVAGVRLAGGRRAQLVIAATERGVLSAHDAVTGVRVWRRALGVRQTRCADLPRGLYGISSTPVADRGSGTVYAVAGDGRAHAVALATGRERPGWPVTVTSAPAREYVWGALALRAGRLYAATASHCASAFFRGRLVAIDVRRARVARTWFALGGRRTGGGMWGWGGVAVDRAGGDVFVATADAIVPPAHAPGADSVVRLSRDLRLRARHHADLPDVQDSEFGGGPLLLRAPGCPAQLMVTHKSGALLLYDRDRLAAGPRQTLQIGRRDFLGTYGTYAWSAAARTLYVANNSSGDLPHGLLALTLDGSCTLQPLWSAPVGTDPALLSPPVVANGVVYLATGFGREVWAFEAATGRALWTSPRLDGAAYGGPAVANGRLFVAAWDQRLHAYTP
jgi:outer membrane protein assembly factor BamB